MRERHILMSAPMIRAILSGAKTQTRRTLREQGWDNVEEPHAYPGEWHPWKGGEPHHTIMCPCGVPGDRLWVRETWAPVWKTEYPPDDVRDCNVQYRADWPNDKYPGHWPEECADDPACGRWKPSIHMPRWASRITLEVTEVRVQRLQEITDADAIAEGMPHPTEWDLDCSSTPPAHHFRRLWDELNGNRAPWASNPWVWCVSFKRVEEKSNAA